MTREVIELIYINKKKMVCQNPPGNIRIIISEQ